MLHLAPIFFGGKLGILRGGGSFYPSNTLGRILLVLFIPIHLYYE